ncbi:MAG TPA: alpha-amylase/4-alpha-glucanotransferase domain-containing protein [Desulfomonilia bacterium]
MSEKIKLAFCIHSHQPVGNYPKVFEQGARDCYLPFLEYLKKYPDIRATLHFTGPLLEWFEKKRPEFYNLLGALISTGQVELMGGGFYEPILPAIPADDAVRQIMMCCEFFLKKFGMKPSGIWCTERVWDPSLPLKISGSGIDYTLLDDTHFLAAGLRPDDVHGYYITEREGASLKVFPIDMNLRYLIPFKEPRVIIDYLLELRDRGVEVVTYGDDGEKFGMWPGTLKWVYEDKWLERFMEAMSRCEDVEIVTLKSVLENHQPKGLIYLPTASYQEMMEWSLFPEQGRLYGSLVRDAKNSWDWNAKRGFLRGGTWDNFLAKYPESNRMHKKMLRISRLVREYGSDETALRHLFMAQCNCGYWHGLFGGVYLDILREAIYENLLKAEKIVDEKRLKDKPYIVENYDYDIDGNDEILVSGRRINCIISPDENGSVFGLEYKPGERCITNVMMRHEEIYHNKILSSSGTQSSHDSGNKPLSIHDIAFVSSDELKSLLVYDSYSRNSFITHVINGRPDTESLLQGLKPEGFPDTLRPFRLDGMSGEGDVLKVMLSANDEGLDITKTITFDPEGSILLEQSISGEIDDDMFLAVEMNIMMPDKPAIKDVGEIDERGIFTGRRMVFNDAGRNLSVCIESDSVWEIVLLPIECASQSESGFEKTFQGWCMYFIRRIKGGIPWLAINMGEICQN